MLLAQRSESLLLRHGVDVCTNNEGDDVEEGNPGGLRQELLRKCKADGRGDPGDLHDLPEPDPHGGANLVIGPGAGNEGHGRKVDRVLHRRNLWRAIIN